MSTVNKEKVLKFCGQIYKRIQWNLKTITSRHKIKAIIMSNRIGSTVSMLVPTRAYIVYNILYVTHVYVYVYCVCIYAIVNFCILVISKIGLSNLHNYYYFVKFNILSLQLTATCLCTT